MPVNVDAAGRSAPAAAAPWLDPLVLGLAALIVVIGLFPRSAAALLLAVLVAGAAHAAMQGRLADAVRRSFGPFLWAALAFTSWSMASALWSADPAASLTKPLYLAASIAGLAVAAGHVPRLEGPMLGRISSGLLIGVLIAGAILALETVTDQGPTKFFYNTFPSLQKGLAKQLTIENGLVTFIQPNNINRRATVVTLLLLPALLAAGSLAVPALRRWALAGVLAIAAIVLLFSTHQSSQAAIVAAGLAFVLCLRWPKAAIVMVAAAWCASCLLMVPLVTALHATDLHKQSDKLFFSARHRIVIWNYTAEQIRKSPVIGVGADATAALNETWSKQMAQTPPAPGQKDGEFVQTTARHAHNVYLQVWYELGGIGAALFTLFGLGGLLAIWRTAPVMRPYYLAEFCAVAAMIAFSFSVWQVWLQAAIGAGLLALFAMHGTKAGRPAKA